MRIWRMALIGACVASPALAQVPMLRTVPGAAPVENRELALANEVRKLRAELDALKAEFRDHAHWYNDSTASKTSTGGVVTGDMTRGTGRPTPYDINKQ